MPNEFVIYNDELCHHGVKGMKWGVRKSPHLKTAAGSRHRARKAEKDARLESLHKDKADSKNGERITAYQAGKRMRQAAQKAKMESINSDREYNRQVRAGRAAIKELMREKGNSTLN